MYEAGRRRASTSTKKKTNGKPATTTEDDDDDDAWLESDDDDDKDDKGDDDDGTAGVSAPVAAGCESVEAALAAITAKYVERVYVTKGSYEPGSMESAAGALNAAAVLHGLACIGPGANEEKSEALVAAVGRGEASAAVAVLLLMNGARVDGGGGDDAADDAGLMEGEVLPAVLAALKAGCGIEGPVMGALRNSAGLQGTLFNVPPSW